MRLTTWPHIRTALAVSTGDLGVEPRIDDVDAATGAHITLTIDTHHQGVLAPSTTPSAIALLTVVLVHGAFADSSGWNGVIERLHARGMTVIAPANPLRGSRLTPPTSLAFSGRFPALFLPSDTPMAVR